MRKIIIMFIVLSGMVGLFSPQALAMCVDRGSLKEYRQAADIVVVGTASIVVDNDGFISVDEYIKGHGPDTVRVTGRAAKDSISSIDFQLQEGKKYLLFLNFAGSDQLRTDACAGNKELGTEGLSAADRSALGKSKITQVVREKLKTGNHYVITTQAMVLMVTSGSIIFGLLLMSILKERKKIKAKPKSKKKKQRK